MGAYVDPKASPVNSSWVGVIKKYTDTYIKHAETTVDHIIKTRLDLIERKNESIVPVSSFTTYNYYYWVDHFDGSTSQKWCNQVSDKSESDPHACEKRDSAWQANKNMVAAMLENSMRLPKDTIKEWKRLQVQPLPKV